MVIHMNTETIGKTSHRPTVTLTPEDRQRIRQLHTEGVTEDELVEMVTRGEEKYRALARNGVRHATASAKRG